MRIGNHCQNSISLFLLLLPLYVGCVYTDMSGCPFWAPRLTFGYDDGMGAIRSGSDLPDHLGQVFLCVFDLSTGRFIRTLLVDRRQLVSSEGFAIGDLPAGSYRIICWGGVSDVNAIHPGAMIDEARIGSPGFSGGDSAIGTTDYLYYASVELQVADIPSYMVAKAPDPIPVLFVCAHILIEVSLIGLPSTHTPIVEFRNLTPQYDFFMEPVAPYSARYQPRVSYIGDPTPRHFCRLVALRFITDNPIEIDIRESQTGELLYTLPLADFMANHTLVVDGTRELTIPIEIRFSAIDVTVDISPWKEEVDGALESETTTLYL